MKRFLILASALLALSLGVAGQTPKYNGKTLGVLGGLGIGTAMGTFQAMAVANVEPWRRGVATSTYMTAFDLGIAIGSLVGGIIADLAGYTAMYFAVALFPIAASVLSAVVIKKAPPKQTTEA